MRRVVITGLGMISSLGRTVNECWESLRAGSVGIRPIEQVDCTQLRFQNGAEVRGFEGTEHFDRKLLVLLDRFAQFALVTAREAVAMAQVEWTPDLRERTAIVTGSCLGGTHSEDEFYANFYGPAAKNAHPLTIPRVMGNAAASHISMEFGVTGPTYNLSTACASATHAIGQAFHLVRSGLVEMSLTGGSDSTFTRSYLKAWEALRVVAPDVCRPFSQDRRGMILGEGGAMLVLESLEAAQARGAHIYGEIVGFGMSADAYHLTQPLSDGAARAMRMALQDARLAPEQIGYINAHGTGTLANDVTEVAALRAVFGAHADRLAISSTKSMHGHALGAAGALEAVATILALQHNLLPPTANFTQPDPQCDLDVIPHEARPAAVEYALSNSFAFGGLNAVLAFRRWLNGKKNLSD